VTAAALGTTPEAGRNITCRTTNYWFWCGDCCKGRPHAFFVVMAKFVPIMMISVLCNSLLGIENMHVNSMTWHKSPLIECLCLNWIASHCTYNSIQSWFCTSAEFLWSNECEKSKHSNHYLQTLKANTQVLNFYQGKEMWLLKMLRPKVMLDSCLLLQITTPGCR
jgi:hypothetical protein